MNYATVEEAEAALLGKVVRMRLDGHPEMIGLVTMVQTFGSYCNNPMPWTGPDARPVATILGSAPNATSSWFANDGDWEIATV